MPPFSSEKEALTVLMRGIVVLLRRVINPAVLLGPTAPRLLSGASLPTALTSGR